MDSLNTILNSGTYGENVSRHNDNNSKIKQAITTLENVAIANKGYFDTLASLQAAFPSPKAGNIAYVANVASSTGYYIYNVVSGVWTATSTEAPAVDVAISNYAQHGYSSSPKTLKQVDDEVVQLADVLGGVQYINQKGSEILTLSETGILLNGSVGTLANYSSSSYIPLPDFDTLEVSTWVSGAWASIAFFSGQTFGSFIKSYSGDGSGKAIIKKEDLQGANYYRVCYKTADLGNFYIKFITGDGVSFQEIKDEIKTTTEIAESLDNQINPKNERIDIPLSDFTLDNYAILRSNGQNSSLTGYKTMPYKSIVGYDAIEIQGGDLDSNDGRVGLAYSPIAFFSGTHSSTFIKTFWPDASGRVYVDFREVPTANYVTLCYMKSIEENYTATLIKNIDKAEKTILVAETLEDAVRQSYKNPKIVAVGNTTFRTRVPKELIKPINNLHTSLDDCFDVVGADNTRNSKLINVEHVTIPRPIIEVSKTGHIYCNGYDLESTASIIGYAEDMNEFLAGNIVNISDAFPEIVIGIREMDNGELAVVTGAKGDNFPHTGCGLYISSDWKTKIETKSKATFVFKQQYSDTKTYGVVPSWSFDVKGSQIMFCEYTVNDAVPKNAIVYYSNDFGNTFNPIFSVYNNLRNDGVFQHIHGVAIDDNNGLLWVFAGENRADEQVFYFSSDKGATWNDMKTWFMNKVRTDGAFSRLHFLAGKILPKSQGILLMTDCQPNGLWKLNYGNFISGQNAATLEEVKRVDLVISPNLPNQPLYSGHERTISHGIGYHTTTNGDYPVFVACPLIGLYSNIYAPDRTGIVYVSFNGHFFHELWRETDIINYPHAEGFKDNSMGVHYDGKHLYIFTANKDISGNNYLIRGVLS